MPYSKWLAGRLGPALAAAGLTATLTACSGSLYPTTPSDNPSNPAAAASGQGAAGTESPVPSGTNPAATASGRGTAGAEAPVPAGSKPPGDIPASTVYARQRFAAGHLSVKVPEGWSRQSGASSATFTNNTNSVTVAWMPMSAAPTVSSARTKTVPQLRAHTPGFRLETVKAMSLPAGPAIAIIYQANSEVNGRQYRLVVERFELYHNGEGGVLTFSTAVGSDNAAPWTTILESVRWT